MKDVCVIYPKEQKSLVKKLISKLESDQISCWTSPRDFNASDNKALKEKIEQSAALLLITDKNTNKDIVANQAVEYALDNNLEIIPYVVDKIESGLYADYFFYAFSWVDAYEDSFKDAYEVLLDAIAEAKGTEHSAKQPVSRRKVNDDNSINIKQIGIIAAVIVAAIAAWFIYDNVSGSEYDKMLEGQWHVVDYMDNLKRTPQDSANFVNNILPSIKKNALLIFNNDHTFERRGFSPEPQVGNWKLNKDASLLTLEPLGIKQPQKLNLQNFTNNSFTIVVTEQLENGSVSTTRLTFKK